MENITAMFYLNNKKQCLPESVPPFRGEKHICRFPQQDFHRSTWMVNQKGHSPSDFPPPQVPRFTNNLNKCKIFWSRAGHSLDSITNPFLLPCSSHLLYDFLPVPLIMRVFRKLKRDKTTLILSHQHGRDSVSSPSGCQ